MIIKNAKRLELITTIVRGVSNIFKHSNHDIDKFILLLRESIYLYRYVDNETSLPKKEDFNSHLNMEDITDAYYMQVKLQSLK